MNCQYSALRVLMLASIVITANANALGLADEPVAELGQLEFDGASLTLPMTEQDGHPKVIVVGLEDDKLVDKRPQLVQPYLQHVHLL